MTAPSDRTRLRALLVLFLVLGAAARLAAFGARRSLWLDEAMVALNIASRPFAELLRPLDYAQNSPLLFLWAERAMVTLFGVSEWSLRAVPLLCGLALLPAAWWVARRFLSPEGAVLAVGVTALSPILVYYANEVKPYGPDALVTALLVGQAARLLERPDDAGRWRLLWVAGAVLLWASSPALFVLGGIGLALLASPAARATRGFWPRLTLTAMLWGASFGTVFVAFLRATTGSHFLQRYFEGLFLAPGSPRLGSRIALAVGGTISGGFFHRDLFEATVPALRLGYVGAALVLCLVGVVAIGRERGWSFAILLAAPVAAAFAASAVRMYPVTARLMSFAMPLLAVLVSAGIVRAVRLRSARPRGAVLAAAGALFLLPAAYHAVESARHPYDEQEHSRPIVRALLDSAPAPATVYVFPQAIPQWLFYSTDWRAPDRARLAFYAAATRPDDGPALQNAPSRGRAVAAGEGAALVYDGRGAPDGRGRREIPGLYSGVEMRPGFEHVPSRADSGWAENEAQRIRAAARPCVRILSIGSTGGALTSLSAALVALGGRTTEVRSGGEAREVEVCFEGR